VYARSINSQSVNEASSELEISSNRANSLELYTFPVETKTIGADERFTVLREL
jgi:hypothetical protein